MPWNTDKSSKPPDTPPTRARRSLRRQGFSWRRRWFHSTPNTSEIVSETRGRVRLSLRLLDFVHVVAVVCLWTFAAGLAQAESVTNVSSTSMANSTSAATPTVGTEAGPNQAANRHMDSSLNKVFYSSLLILLVPLAAYVTATLIKIICPMAKTPGSFCCPKYQIGDSGEADAERNADAEKAVRDEKRVKNALLLLFTIDVNEEKEEEEELKEIEKAMKRLKERRLRKMRNMIVRQPFRVGADDKNNGRIGTAFSPPGEAQPVAQCDASEGIGVTEKDCIDTDSNPVEPTHNQDALEETTQMSVDPIVENPNDAVSINENKAASNASSVGNIPQQNIHTVGDSGSASKTEPFENGGPSCAVTNPPVSVLESTSTNHEKSNFIPKSTGIIGPVDASGSRNSNNSSICAVEIVDVKKPERNLSTISASTVTLVQSHSECNDKTPTNKPPIEKSEPKETVLKDKAKQTASSPVTDDTLQKQTDGNPAHLTCSSSAKNNEPVNINSEASSSNLTHEMLPETKAAAETATGINETHQSSTAANLPKKTVVVDTDISQMEHVQTNTNLERVNIDPDVSSLRSVESHTCSNSSERIPRGKRHEEASSKPEGRGHQNTVPLKAILVQTADID